MHTFLPFESADIRFTLKANGERTVVTVSPLYRLKYGLAGQLLNLVYVAKNYKTGMEMLHAGLKAFVEHS